MSTSMFMFMSMSVTFTVHVQVHVQIDLQVQVHVHVFMYGKCSCTYRIHVQIQVRDFRTKTNLTLSMKRQRYEKGQSLFLTIFTQSPYRSVFPFCLLKLPSEGRSIVFSSEGSGDPFSGILDIRLAQGDACQDLLQHSHKREKVYQ
jgi:hypothetical protein